MKKCEGRIYIHKIIIFNLIRTSFFSPQNKDDQLREADDKLTDHSDMYVLDFKPTLRTLCMKAVRKNKLEISSLPNNLK